MSSMQIALRQGYQFINLLSLYSLLQDLVLALDSYSSHQQNTHLNLLSLLTNLKEKYLQ